MSDCDDVLFTCRIESPEQMYEIGRAFASSFLRPCFAQDHSEAKAPVTLSLFGSKGSGKSILTGGCHDGLAGQETYKHDFRTTNGFGYRKLALHFTTQDAIGVCSTDQGGSLMPTISELSVGNHPSFEATCLLKRQRPFHGIFPGKSNHVYFVEHPTIAPLYATDVICLVGNLSCAWEAESYFKGLQYYAFTAIATNKGTLTSDIFEEMNVPLSEHYKKQAENLALRLLPQIKEMRTQIKSLADSEAMRMMGCEREGQRLVSFVLLSDSRAEPFRNFGKQFQKIASSSSQNDALSL